MVQSFARTAASSVGSTTAGMRSRLGAALFGGIFNPSTGYSLEPCPGGECPDPDLMEKPAQHFDYCYPAAKAKDLCAFHASELPFVFGNLDSESLPPNWPVPDGDQDQAISKALLDYWTSFAATGQPESVYGPVWSSYGQDQSYLDIGQTLASRTDPIPGMFELHEQLVAERKAASEPWFLNIGLGARPLSDAAGNEAE